MKNPIANNRKFAALLGAITLALMLIGIALRIINLYCNFEMETGYYYSSALLPDIMHVFFALSVLTLGILSFVMVKKISLEAIELKKDPTANVVLCFLAIAALIYIVAKSYFDILFALNSPNKILLHMACLAAMFFFLTLARLNLDVLKEKSYLFFISSTVFLCGVYAIPSMFFCVISPIYKEYTYFYFDIAIFAVFVFAAIKLIALVLTKKPQPPVEPIAEIENISDETDNISENNDTTPANTEEE